MFSNNLVKYLIVIVLCMLATSVLRMVPSWYFSDPWVIETRAIYALVVRSQFFRRLLLLPVLKWVSLICLILFFFAIWISLGLTYFLTDMMKKISTPAIVPFDLKRRPPSKSSAPTPLKTTEPSKFPRGKMVSSERSGTKDHLVPMLKFLDHFTTEDVELIKSWSSVDLLISATLMLASLLFHSSL